MSAGRVSRHACINDIIRRALMAINVPAVLEPSGIFRDDGKRPDGMTLIPWKQGRPLVWDATCADTLAPCHTESTSLAAGAAAASAECSKRRKYSALNENYIFVPFGVETIGPWGPSARSFFREISKRLAEVTGDQKTGSYLGQRISLAIQRCNAASLLGTIPDGGDGGLMGRPKGCSVPFQMLRIDLDVPLPSNRKLNTMLGEVIHPDKCFSSNRTYNRILLIEYSNRTNKIVPLTAYLTHRWAKALETKGEALAVGLDIAKAFDRVWHKALLSKLPSYGLPEKLCVWITSFLADRSIKVAVDGACSDSKSVNAGVPQGCVLSPTLFLLHINDMHQIDGIHCYADDSTGDALYTGRANISRENVIECRNKLVSEVETLLNRVTNWGRLNLVQFNPTKTQVCAFTAKKIPFVVSPLFENTPLTASASIGILGVDISSDVQFRDHLEGKAKLASKKLGVLNRSTMYFTPAHRLQLYKAQIRPHMEYCSHLWAGAPQYQLLPLDRIQRRAARIVDDQDLSDQLDPLALRRDVATLCIFYRIYHGECSEELFGLIPAAAFRHRTSRQKFHPHHLDAWLSTTAGIAFVILLVLQVSMGNGDHLPSGEPFAHIPPITKKKHTATGIVRGRSALLFAIPYFIIKLNVLSFIDDVVGAVGGVVNAAGNAVTGVVGSVTGVTSSILTALTNTLTSVLGAVGTVIGGLLTQVTGLVNLALGIVKNLSDVIASVGGALSNVLNAVALIKQLGDVFTQISGILKNIGELIASSVTSLGSALGKALGSVVGEVLKVVSTLVASIGDVLISLSKALVS
ncbi:hypothetical protein evm_008160 [Chilo suppressalis]|nr:hypothetical protein evm_008160 [Chilo suppressalis]